MLTLEQRAELERRGWSVTGLYKGTGTTARWGTAVIQEWAKKQTDGRLLVGNDRVWWEGDLQMAAEIAAVLGITPSGYRLVPDSAAREAACVSGLPVPAPWLRNHHHRQRVRGLPTL